MTFPLNLGIGEYTVNAHLVFETLAFMIGFRYFVYLRKKTTDTIEEGNRIWILIGATAGAFLFSRLIGALENPVNFIRASNILLYFYSSKTIVGGLLGGLLGVEITKKIIGETRSSGDLFTYPLILAMCIGRIGCFTMGVYEDTYGEPTDLFWGMNLGDGISRHPVALYEIAFLCLLFLGLKQVEKKVAFPEGHRFQWFMIAYLTFRFLLDFIKPGYTYFWGIGTIQICCLIGIIYYIKLRSFKETTK